MYRYGIQRTRGGKVSTYVCKDQDVVSHTERYPEKDGGTVLKEEISECTAQEAYDRANEMMKRHLSPGSFKVERVMLLIIQILRDHIKQLFWVMPPEMITFELYSLRVLLGLGFGDRVLRNWGVQVLRTPGRRFWHL